MYKSIFSRQMYCRLGFHIGRLLNSENFSCISSWKLAMSGVLVLIFIFLFHSKLKSAGPKRQCLYKIDSEIISKRTRSKSRPGKTHFGRNSIKMGLESSYLGEFQVFAIGSTRSSRFWPTWSQSNFRKFLRCL